jgi:hypothetical protein
LGTWLKREGLSQVSKSEILEIAKRLLSEGKDVSAWKAKLQNELPPPK